MNLKGFIHRWIEDLTNPFFELYFRAKKIHPMDWSCFPLLQINCIGCFGCIHNKHPPFGQISSGGPWEVRLAPTFRQQYADMFGEDALAKLVETLEKHNIEVREARSKEGD